MGREYQILPMKKTHRAIVPLRHRLAASDSNGARPAAAVLQLLQRGNAQGSQCFGDAFTVSVGANNEQRKP